MGQNGIPLFYFFFKLTNKKNVFGDIYMSFRNGINMPAAHLFRYRKGICTVYADTREKR